MYFVKQTFHKNILPQGSLDTRNTSPKKLTFQRSHQFANVSSQSLQPHLRRRQPSILSSFLGPPEPWALWCLWKQCASELCERAGRTSAGGTHPGTESASAVEASVNVTEHLQGSPGQLAPRCALCRDLSDSDIFPVCVAASSLSCFLMAFMCYRTEPPRDTQQGWGLLLSPANAFPNLMWWTTSLCLPLSCSTTLPPPPKLTGGL